MIDEIEIVAILILALISGLTTLIGVALAIHVSRNVSWIALGIGFSAGIMLCISLFELIPEALTIASTATVFCSMFAGVGLLAALHYYIPHTHLFAETEMGRFGRRELRTGYLVAFGLILHDVPEGFAMANAYISSPSLGLFVAIAIAIHNIPEEFSLAVPAVVTAQRGLLYRAAVVSAMAEPFGALWGLAAVSASPALVPLFLSFAAGAMTFVSLHELIPLARTYQRHRWFASGLAASGLVYLAMERWLPAV